MIDPLTDKEMIDYLWDLNTRLRKEMLKSFWAGVYVGFSLTGILVTLCAYVYTTWL